MVLAQTANAFPIATIADNIPSYSIATQHDNSATPSISIDEESPSDTVNLPRLNRACASVFSNEVQSSPNYLLIIEFFEIKLSAALFKNLANPPAQLNWHEKLSHQSNSSRLSGWKDSNTLYKYINTYPS